MSKENVVKFPCGKTAKVQPQDEDQYHVDLLHVAIAIVDHVNRGDIEVALEVTEALHEALKDGAGDPKTRTVLLGGRLTKIVSETDLSAVFFDPDHMK